MAKIETVIIIGGGFGGVKTALSLRGSKHYKILLITDKPYFLYYPALYSTATGHSHKQSWVPLSEIFPEESNITVIIDEIVSIAPERKIVVGGSNKQYSFDQCVLALGVVTTYFGIEGLAEYSYNIKTVDQVNRFKHHLHNELIETGHFDKNYIVVGAGPTGVELSSALVSYLERVREHHKIKKGKIHVRLIEASPRVLPRMSERVSKRVHERLTRLGVKVEVNKKVEAQDDDSLMIDGRDVPTKTVIWTSGVTNHPFYAQNSQHFHLAPNGKVIVDEHMMAAPNVYVIGDNAASSIGLAQIALHDALFMAKLLRRRAAGRPLPIYRVISPPSVIPVGERWAVLEWRKIRLYGWPASIVRSLADFIGYNDVLPIGLALDTWRSQRTVEEECSICAESI